MPLRNNSIGEIRRFIKPHGSEIDQVWRAHDRHLQNSIGVGILEKRRNPKSVDLSHVKITEPEICITLADVRLFPGMHLHCGGAGGFVDSAVFPLTEPSNCGDSGVRRQKSSREVHIRRKDTKLVSNFQILTLELKGNLTFCGLFV